MCHALIIEDEPFVAMQMEEALLDAGADSVEIAVTEREAIAAAGQQRPDFIVSDVKLLEGTGPAAVEAILRAAGAIPVVFVTAWPQACEAFRDRATILTKPVGMARLVTAFQAMTGAC